MGLVYNNQENVVGDLIRKKREELNMSRQEFANLAEMSKSAIVSYELGISKPNTVSAIKLAKALECDIIEFLSYIKQPDVYDDSEIIRVYDMEIGFNIDDFPHRMAQTYNIRKNEKPDRHFCVLYEGRAMLFMNKKNRFGKEPLVLIVRENSEKVQFANFTGGKLFDFENNQEIKKARIIAQFKRCIKVQ